MNPDIKKDWIEALRSGEFKQAKATLKGYAYDDKGNVAGAGYCCLGVLAHVVKEKHPDLIPPRLRIVEGEGCLYIEDVVSDKRTSGYLYDPLRSAIGLDNRLVDDLIDMNDGNTERGVEPCSFNAIADRIEKDA